MRTWVCLLIATVGITLSAALTHAADIETVVFQQAGQRHEITGELQLTAQDGGVLLLGPDGTLWAVEPDELISRTSLATEFVPLTGTELHEQLLAELPPGFQIHTTENYTIAYNTSRPYAQWIGFLFERLSDAFTKYWQRRGLELQSPRLPLIAVVFADKQSYMQHVQKELGSAAEVVVGFYSLESNRIYMYDLTGIEAYRQGNDRRSTTSEINQILRRPEAEPMVATIIHEATHQLTFNTGMHQRFAAIPVWLSEGMAIFFESPDLSSSRGWKTLGGVHHSRLYQFRQYLPQRSENSLYSLLLDDNRIRNSRTATDAYAEAWALNYFLIRHRSKQYVAYLKLLQEKSPLIPDTPEERLADFKAAFGENIEALERDFLRYMQRVR